MLRTLTRAAASSRAGAPASRAIASTSRASLDEDDKDGGKTIEIIEANLVRLDALARARNL
jgi:hypothetical protein